MKFKVAGVFSGYNEMSIEGVVLINWSNDNIEDLVEKCFDALKNKFVNIGELGVWNELGIKGVINETLGYYGCDEEGFNVVIREDNKWFNRLSNVENWTDNEYEEWKEFCNSIA